MRPRISWRMLHVALAAAGPACGGSTEPLAPCTGPVSVTVSGGTTPTIGWTPECAVDFLMVAEPLPPSQGLGEEPRWMIGAASPIIEPSVRYGQTPRGADELFAPDPLRTGRTYRVVVENGPTELGSRMFTP